MISEGAGSVAAPLYAGLVSDRLPAAKITVLVDGAGAYPEDPRINKLIAGGASQTPCHAGARTPA